MTWYVHPRTGQRAVCPFCRSDAIFDNRATKKNPKAPDIRCGDCKEVATVYEDGSWRWWTNEGSRRRA